MSPTNSAQSMEYMNVTMSTTSKSSEKSPAVPPRSDRMLKTDLASSMKTNDKLVDCVAVLGCSSLSDTSVELIPQKAQSTKLNMAVASNLPGYMCMTAGRKTPATFSEDISMFKLHSGNPKYCLLPNDDTLAHAISKLALKIHYYQNGVNAKPLKLDDDDYLIMDSIAETTFTKCEGHARDYENIRSNDCVHMNPSGTLSNMHTSVAEQIMKIQRSNMNSNKRTTSTSHYENDVKTILPPLRRPIAPVRRYSDTRMRPPTTDAPSDVIQTRPKTSRYNAARNTSSARTLTTAANSKPVVTATRCYRKSTMPTNVNTCTFKPPTTLPLGSFSTVTSTAEPIITYRGANVVVSKQKLPLCEKGSLVMTDCMVIKMDHGDVIVAAAPHANQVNATLQVNQGSAGTSTASDAIRAEPQRERKGTCCTIM